MKHPLVKAKLSKKSILRSTAIEFLNKMANRKSYNREKMIWVTGISFNSKKASKSMESAL